MGPQALTAQPLGPSREHVQQNNFRFNPYQRPLFCLTCGKSGHLESRCCVRFPHLRPAWLRMPPGVVPSSDPRSVPPVPSLHSPHVVVDIIPREVTALFYLMHTTTIWVLLSVFRAPTPRLILLMMSPSCLYTKLWAIASFSPTNIVSH